MIGAQDGAGGAERDEYRKRAPQTPKLGRVLLPQRREARLAEARCWGTPDA